jgi:uncharacterized radical SAM superfamily Fe-S cluster-containing enzyme
MAFQLKHAGVSTLYMSFDGVSKRSKPEEPLGGTSDA